MVTAKKIDKKGKKLETPAIQQESPIWAICDVIGPFTHIFLELDELKPFLRSEADIATPRSR